MPMQTRLQTDFEEEIEVINFLRIPAKFLFFKKNADYFNVIRNTIQF